MRIRITPPLARPRGAVVGRAALAVAALACAAFLASSSLPAILAQGETFTVELRVVDAEGLAAFDAEIRYDPTRVEPRGLTGGDFLPEGSEMLGPVLVEPDRLRVGSFATGGQTSTGGGVLAVLTFQRLGHETGELSLVAERSGAYDATGASIAPPARLALGDGPATTARVYLPIAAR